MMEAQQLYSVMPFTQKKLGEQPPRTLSQYQSACCLFMLHFLFALSTHLDPNLTMLLLMSNQTVSLLNILLY